MKDNTEQTMVEARTNLHSYMLKQPDNCMQVGVTNNNLVVKADNSEEFIDYLEKTGALVTKLDKYVGTGAPTKQMLEEDRKVLLYVTDWENADSTRVYYSIRDLEYAVIVDETLFKLIISNLNILELSLPYRLIYEDLVKVKQELQKDVKSELEKYTKHNKVDLGIKEGTEMFYINTLIVQYLVTQDSLVDTYNVLESMKGIKHEAAIDYLETDDE